MDIGGRGLPSHEENAFSGFPALNLQGSWVPAPPVKPCPTRRQTANGDEELLWLSNLGISAALYKPELSLHNANPAEASYSGSAATSCGNPVGDLNIPADEGDPWQRQVYGNAAVVAAGLGHRWGSAAPSFTEDLTSVFTCNSMQSTLPTTMHPRNNGGWQRNQVQNPFPVMAPSLGDRIWQQSCFAVEDDLNIRYPPEMSQYGILSHDKFVYGIKSSYSKAIASSTSGIVAPVTPDKVVGKRVDSSTSTPLNLCATRELRGDDRVQQKILFDPHTVSRSQPHKERMLVEKNKWNDNYLPHTTQFGFPVPYNEFVYDESLSNKEVTFGTSSTVEAPVAPLTPEKPVGKGLETTASTLYTTRELPRDDRVQQQKYAVASRNTYDVSQNECSIHQEETLKHLVDSQQSVTHLPLEDNNGLKKVPANNGVDPNKTPPQKPKRRKIRPKVVKEDKPQRSSKKEQANQTPEVTQTERKKRPYKRKIKEVSTTSPADAKENGSSPKATSVTSCRRSLNFDFDAQVQEDCARVQSDSYRFGSVSKDIVAAENTRGPRTFDLNHSIDNVSSPHIPLSQNSLPSLAKRKASINWNQEDMARKKNSLGNEGVDKEHQKDFSTASSNYVLQSSSVGSKVVPNTAHKDESVPSLLLTSTQVPTTFSGSVQTKPRGSAELTISSKHTMDTHQHPSHGWSLAELVDEYNRLRQMEDGNYKLHPSQESFRNQKIETLPPGEESCRAPISNHQNVCGMEAAAAAAAGGECRPVHANQLISQTGNGMLPSQTASKEEQKVTQQNKCSKNGIELETEQQHGQMKQSYPGNRYLSFQHVQDHNSVIAQMVEKRNRSASIASNHICHPFLLLSAIGRSSLTGYFMQDKGNGSGPQRCQEALVVEDTPLKETKKRGKRTNSQTAKHGPSRAPVSQMSHAALNIDSINKPETLAIPEGDSSQHHQGNKSMQESFSTRFPPLQANLNTNPIDEIVHILKHLDIGGKNDDFVAAIAGDAIVPYVATGTIIPYEPRRRRPRPKVDLDEETNRVWKLLMGNSNEGIDGTDADKEKWWEEERRVFRGRADSFIARMHLVQGDRRFSRWKGSVVDSVVGVFLTQNVSDHLSSSAFMAMAARFPTKEKVECATPGNSKTMPSATGQLLFPTDLNETITHLTKSPSIKNTNSDDTPVEIQHSGQTEPIFLNKINKTESCGYNTTGDKESCIKMINSNEEKVIQESAGSTSNFQSIAENEGRLVEPEDRNSISISVISSQDSTDSTAHAIDQIGSTAEFTTPVEEPISRGKCKSLKQQSFSELLLMAGTPWLFKDLCAKESLYLSLGHKIRSTSDQLLHRVSETNINKGMGAESSSGVGNNTSTSNMSNNLPTEATSCITAIPVEDHTPSFPNKATDSQFKDSQEANFTVQQASLQSPTKGKDIVDANALEHTRAVENQKIMKNKLNIIPNDEAVSNEKSRSRRRVFTAKKGESLSTKEKWEPLRKQALEKFGDKERSLGRKDSVDWEAVRHADVNNVAETIKERGMNNMLAARIQEFLNRLVEDHGSIDLEWLRDVPPDKAKDFLLSVNGLGLKSVECVRLLTLHHLAFPVDTNVGRICVRLGWVPLQPLPESLQLHLLELYPVLESIQKYLWPRLCKLDQRTLYELHYQLITFGKVFCTKSRPNCNACPMRGECRHFASAFASARLALPGPEEKSLVSSSVPITVEQEPQKVLIQPISVPPRKELLPAVECPKDQKDCNIRKCEPIIEEPTTPEPEYIENCESAIEDFNYDDPDEIPTIKLNLEELTLHVQNYIQDKSMGLQNPDMSQALVALTPEAASIPTPKLKNVSRLRTEHQVYELPDNHPLINELDKRELDDPCSYLLAIWAPGETAESVEPPKACCDYENSGNLCDRETCFSCNTIREANAQTVRGTLLIPCRTAMRGSFPLNGTYFQVNEVFADHESSLNPIAVPRALIWNLPRKTVYFGTSVTSIFKGLTTEGIQYCFWRGFVCVRGFDQKTRAPRPLMARLHFPASKQTRDKRKVARNSDEYAEQLTR